MAVVDTIGISLATDRAAMGLRFEKRSVGRLVDSIQLTPGLVAHLLRILQAAAPAAVHVLQLNVTDVRRPLRARRLCATRIAAIPCSPITRTTVGTNAHPPLYDAFLK